MDTFKHCIEMEQLYRSLALKEPHNRQHWLAAAEKWHRRAGQVLLLTSVENAPPSLPDDDKASDKKSPIAGA